jgi:hypothetical protein
MAVGQLNHLKRPYKWANPMALRFPGSIYILTIKLIIPG